MTGWLVTGGAGYVGAHVVWAMLQAGERVVVLDDLTTGDLVRVPARVPAVLGSVGDVEIVRRVLRENQVHGVVHVAAKHSVAASLVDPAHYYAENVGGLAALITAMREEGVGRLVHASSAAVYGSPPLEYVPESAPARPDNPYGRTKLACEWLVRDAVAAHGFSAAVLRLFNVVGCAELRLADTSGTGLFSRLVARVAQDRPLTVFGNDYPTRDGTAIRDYVHAWDVAWAHVAATALTGTPGRCEVLNIGGGRGYTVMEVLAQVAGTLRRPVAHIVGARRPGDPVALVADVNRAATLLGWQPRFGLAEMVSSACAAGPDPDQSQEG